MQFWTVSCVVLMAAASAAVGGPVPPAASPSRTLADQVAGRQAPIAGAAWQRLQFDAAANDAGAARSYRYSTGIRGTLISWTGHWSSPASATPPPEGTVQPPPVDGYRPPEGTPQQPPPVVPVIPSAPPSTVGIPSPTASLLGVIGLVLLARVRRLSREFA